MKLSQYMMETRDATVAARQRTGFAGISTQAAPHFRTVVCLTIYRTRGTSIVLPMTEALEHSAALAYLNALDRDAICARLVMRIEELEERMLTHEASPRLVHDAGLLKDHVQTMKGE